MTQSTFDTVWVQNSSNTSPALQVGNSGTSANTGDLVVYGNIVGTGAAQLLSSLKVYGTLNAQGFATLSGGVSSPNGSFTTLAATSSLSVLGTATLSGSTALSGTTTVSGIATVSGTVTFTAATPPSFQNGLTTTFFTASAGLSSAPAFSVNGNPSIAVPYNGYLTNQIGFASQFSYGTTTKVGQIGTVGIKGSEYLSAYVLKSNTGATANLNSANKVALYSETDVQQNGTTSGSGPAWSLNTLLYIDSSVGPLTTGSITGWAATGYELDVSNQSTVAFGSGGPGSVFGLNISAGGVNNVTAAMVINGADSVSHATNLFTSGIVFNGGAVSVSSISDWGNATWAHYVAGTRSYGIDTTAASFSTGGSAIRLGGASLLWQPSTTYAVNQIRANGAYAYRVLTAGTSAASGGPTGYTSPITDGTVVWQYIGTPSQQRIVAYDYQKGADVQLLAYVIPAAVGSQSGYLSLGDPNFAPLQVANSVVPSVNNSLGLGASGSVFHDLWVTNINGTIYTPSSPSLKTDIAGMPDMLPLIMAIQPKTYKWAAGDVEFVEVDEVQDMQAFEEISETLETIEIRSGVPTQITKEVVRTVPVFDEVPVVDMMGQTVIVRRDESAPEFGPDGKVMREGVPAYSRPLTHRVPRMVEKTVQVRKPRPIADNRIHFGFLAPDVKAAFDAMGIDFGGYKRYPDGMEALRPDAQIAILWKAVQELAGRIEALEQRAI